MVLQMYLDGKLIDSSVLTKNKMADGQEWEWYVQGAVNELLERWDDRLQEQKLQPEFFIKVESFRTE